ncbi:MAG TPA: methyltransferase domain-containing protein [Pyrinomonadaceae bacterium]|nr:methyltransferase domain-containing protein [Pyrinomonadaceae bacterium]
MNFLSPFMRSEFSVFGDSATIPSAQLPERASYETQVVQEAVRQSSTTLNPHGKTRFQNMGYWAGGISTLDDAATALAKVVAEAAEFGTDDQILDVGCGFGDQDFLWMEQYSPERLVAVDIDSAHIQTARDTARDRSVSGSLEFRVASAIALTSLRESFNKVVSLEAAHEFMTREDFFREAYHVLAPAGRLVTTDILPLPGQRVQHFTMHPANNYSRIVYAEKLRDAGFVNVKIRSIRDLVLKPFTKYMETLSNARGLGGKLRMFKRRRLSSQLDYVLATADKPAPLASPAELRCPMGSF